MYWCRYGFNFSFDLWMGGVMNFDEWANDQPLANRIVMANCCRNAFRGGAESRQAEVDEYKLVAETLDDLYVKEIVKNRELQKRIDDAVNCVCTSFNPSKALIIKILKGELK